MVRSFVDTIPLRGRPGAGRAALAPAASRLGSDRSDFGSRRARASGEASSTSESRRRALRLCCGRASTGANGRGQAAAGSLPALRRRDVGALLVLRNEGDAGPLPDRQRARRLRLVEAGGRSAVRALRLLRLCAAARRRLPGRSADRHPPVDGHRRVHHRRRSLLSRRAVDDDVLSRAGAGGDRDRLLQAERLDDGRPALRRARSAPRRRVHHLLHGRQRRRPAGSAGMRLLRREPALGLALRFRRGRRRHGVRPGALPLLKARYLPGIGLAPNRAAAPRPASAVGATIARSRASSATACSRCW